MQAAINSAPEGAPVLTETLPGPTGESNRLSTQSRAPVLCLGPGHQTADKQAAEIKRLGGRAVAASGFMRPSDLTKLKGFSGVMWWGDNDTARAYEIALSERNGAIIPLIVGSPDVTRARSERHVCVDTTASGGNAALLGGAS
jgi:RHH-type proline utilization regulon transcriptional repressor/proline dehydrogenase/delta 1-pyrroline-5-carboxylate dehydrogenase